MRTFKNDDPRTCDDNDNDDAIYFPTKVKCTNDMMSFKKNHKLGDDDPETVNRMRKIGLVFGTMQNVIMMTVMALIPIMMSKSQKQRGRSTPYFYTDNAHYKLQWR